MSFNAISYFELMKSIADIGYSASMGADPLGLR